MLVLAAPPRAKLRAGAETTTDALIEDIKSTPGWGHVEIPYAVSGYDPLLSLVTSKQPPPTPTPNQRQRQQQDQRDGGGGATRSRARRPSARGGRGIAGAGASRGAGAGVEGVLDADDLVKRTEFIEDWTRCPTCGRETNPWVYKQNWGTIGCTHPECAGNDYLVRLRKPDQWELFTEERKRCRDVLVSDLERLLSSDEMGALKQVRKYQRNEDDTVRVRARTTKATGPVEGKKCCYCGIGLWVSRPDFHIESGDWIYCSMTCRVRAGGAGR